MEISDMLNKKLIFLNENFDNTSELFDFVGSKTKELGLSRDNYAANLKKREADFPTALEFNDIGLQSRMLTQNL
ncbi:PTS sugar transporter subunit IIA [Tetragenococcus halophilus]|nr:PTS sugar transporter subunit IIA [Tetragenococcus halophilus]